MIDLSSVSYPCELVKKRWARHFLFVPAIFFSIFFGGVLLFPLLASAVIVEGRVFTENGPLPMASVYLYAEYKDIEADRPLLISRPTDKDGVYKMPVPAGKYFFSARGFVQGDEYIAFHGSNPIMLENRDVWLSFMAQKAVAPSYSKGDSVLKGTVMFKGKPLTDGAVTVYLPDTGIFKGLGVKTQSINPDGTFFMPLPAGKYVVSAKRIEATRSVGPPQKRDLVGYFPLNPIEVRAGEDVSVEVPTYPKGDRTPFTDVAAVKANDLITPDALAKANGAGLHGTVKDAAGKPFAGIFVLAYRAASSAFQMFDMTHGTTNCVKTGSDGTYFLPLDDAGDYSVVARDVLGEGKHAGQTFGVYQKDSTSRVSFQSGQRLGGIDIVVRTTESETEESQPQPPVRWENREFLGDTAILRDTVLAGDILVGGVMVVNKDATLTIEPGTKIRFKWIDRDNNGIGDAQLLVEGRIVAKGNSKNKIVFTSGKQEPSPRDWASINVLATEESNLFEHCVIEYAASGLQINYSDLKIVNCLFRKNGEGIFFNSANLVVEHNNLLENVVGIRFTRSKGDVLVRYNVVNRNMIGIQFEQQASAKPTTVPFFVQNNIFGNSSFNYSIGYGQTADIAVGQNWWGSIDRAEVDRLIMDKNDNDLLGRVQFEPTLDAVVNDAGIQGE